MTEAYEDDWLVRVRAQVMSRDEGTGGWVALGAGGLANVMVGKRQRPAHFPVWTSGGESSTEESGPRPPHTHAPNYEYFIYGKRISDESVVLSCTIKKDFQYNKVMPTFHHWVTDEKRFGLTFQTAADARAFDKGVRIAIEELLDGLGGAWPSLHAYKKLNPAPRDDDEENNIFECLNLPSDSRSSSENSTASRTHRRGIADKENTQTPILSAISLPHYTSACRARISSPLARPDGTGKSTRISDDSTASGGRGTTENDNTQAPILYAVFLPQHTSADRAPISSPIEPLDETSLASKELLMKQKISGSCSEEPDKIPYLDETLDADNYSYVHLTAVHEYTYPQLGAAGVISSEKSSPNTKPPLAKRDSGSIKKRSMPCYTPSPPPLPDKKPAKPPDTTFQARHKCRHCHEWYLESANQAGACEFAPDCFRTCIDAVTCIKCAQCMLYHCMSDAEGEFVAHPCACGPPDKSCTKRWVGITLLSFLVPCLWCYPLLRCTHSVARSCHIAGGKHAPHHPSQHS